MIGRKARNALVPEWMELGGWTAGCYQPAAELIHAAYAEHIDASINDQYRTLHGSLRFLHNIVRFPGCGVFEANSSLVLRDRGVDALAGILLCSRVAPDVAHITQICVAEKYRRRGLGRASDGTFYRPSGRCRVFSDHAYCDRIEPAGGAAV